MNVWSLLMLSARYFRLWSAVFLLLTVETYHSGFNMSINKEKNPQTPLEVTPVTYAFTSPSVRLVGIFSLEMKLVMMNFGWYYLQLVMFLRVKRIKFKSWLLWKTLGFCLIIELFCMILRACWWKFFSILLWLFKILEEDEIKHHQCLSHGGLDRLHFYTSVNGSSLFKPSKRVFLNFLRGSTTLLQAESIFRMQTVSANLCH